jgi:hypothetical protein
MQPWWRIFNEVETKVFYSVVALKFAGLPHHCILTDYVFNSMFLKFLEFGGFILKTAARTYFWKQYSFCLFKLLASIAPNFVDVLITTCPFHFWWAPYIYIYISGVRCLLVFTWLKFALNCKLTEKAWLRCIDENIIDDRWVYYNTVI